MRRSHGPDLPGRTRCTVHFIPRIILSGEGGGGSISHPGGYTHLSVKYPGSGYFIPGTHLASPR